MQAVDRVIGVLMCFAEGEAEMGVTEVARRLGLPKSAVHRILESLVSTGLVLKLHDRSKYRLGPRAMELSLATFGTADVQSMARPTMQDLRDEVGETVTLSLRIHRQRMYVAQAECREPVRMTVEVGQRAPLYAGSSGRAILMTFGHDELDEYFDDVELTPLTERTLSDAQQLRDVLDEDRARGYAISVGERDIYATSVAAPLMSSTGHAFGCLSICGPRQRLSGEVLKRCGPAVIRATKELSEMVARP